MYEHIFAVSLYFFFVMEVWGDFFVMEKIQKFRILRIQIYFKLLKFINFILKTPKISTLIIKTHHFYDKWAKKKHENFKLHSIMTHHLKFIKTIFYISKSFSSSSFNNFFTRNFHFYLAKKFLFSCWKFFINFFRCSQNLCNTHSGT